MIADRALAGTATNNEVREQATVRYEMLTDIEDVRLIASKWDDLLATSRCNLAFSCSKWYLARVELLPTVQPLVFTAYRDQVLSGVLPFWLNSSRRVAIFEDDYCDYLDIIAADDDREVITGLLQLALRGGGGYDRLVLGPVKYDSNFVSGAKALGLGEAVDEFFITGKVLTYAVIDLKSGYDEYMKTLGRKFRHNLRRMLTKASRDGLVVRELKPVDLLPELLPETFLALHRSRFGDRSDFTAVEGWIRRLLPALFIEGRMRVFALLAKDRIVGIDLVAVTRSAMFSYPGGFLPEVHQYDPGKLLIHHTIAQACLEGMAEVELGSWIQGYKGHWRPDRREVGNLEFAAGLKQQ